MAQVVPLFATRDDVERAWEAYDAAVLAERAAYADTASARHDRLSASLAVARTHREFTRLYNRWPVEESC